MSASYNRHRPYLLAALVIALIILELLLPRAFADSVPLKKVAFTEAELNQLTGHYSTVFGYIVVQRHKQQGITRVDDKRIYLIKKSDQHIYAVYRLLGLIPVSEDDVSFTLKQERGRTVVILHTQDKQGKPYTEVVGEKFTPVAIPAVWRTRIGRYKVLSQTQKMPIKKITLRMKQKVLVAQINDDSEEYPLLPRSDNNAYIPGVGKQQNRQLQLKMQGDSYQLLIGDNIMQLERI